MPQWTLPAEITQAPLDFLWNLNPRGFRPLLAAQEFSGNRRM
jgi:hypothetical protein